MREQRETLLVVCVILLFIAFFALAFSRVAATETRPPGSKARSQPEQNQCTGCHEMNPEILTWQLSSHSNVPCTACHNIKPAYFQTKHDAKNFTRPIKIFEAIPNSVCEGCHSPNRVMTVSGDLIIPHEKHTKAGLTCVKCHSGVVHANIAERGLTTDYETWNLEKARKAATKFYLQPSMWTCIDCHKQLRITRKCSACHTAIPDLPSHEQPSWQENHGKTARAAIGECTKCHVTPGAPKFVTPSTGDQAADFARAQAFCYNCHLKRPQTHGSSMVPLHPGKTKDKGIQNCLTCHNRQQPGTGSNVAGTYCNQCHWF
ncbi:MAG: hypothetical protein M0Z31_07775 [Clostridia bacterium]|nr:hypothetical protein [Clostridia bacterium]